MRVSIVSYLDPDASSLVRKIQNELSTLTGSKASISSWEPHVTVGDGLEVDERQLEYLKESAMLLANNASTLKLRLRGIGSLDDWKGGEDETPYVIYLNVVLNNGFLKIVDKVGLSTAHYEKWYLMPRPYLPHCTLAFRDLTKEGYEKGLRYLEQVNPNISATIDHIALVEKLPDVDRELARFKFAD